MRYARCKKSSPLCCDHSMRVSLAALFVMLLAAPKSMGYPNYNTDPIPPDYSGMTNVAQQIAGKVQAGWNMGNSLEAYGCNPPSETCWGNPMITASLVQLIKQSGFDAIRLPCSFDQYANQSTAAISATWLNRVKEVVQYCVDEDMYVILNIHWDGGWLENNVTTSAQAAVNAKQKAYWEQIATHLRDFDEHLLFASANEPNVDAYANQSVQEEQMSVLMSYHQTFIDAVRSTGGRNAYRTLVVQGPNTDIALTDELMNSMPTDTVENRMMVEIHYYTPWQFCGLAEDAGWGSMFYYWGADYHSTIEPSRNAYWGEEDELDSLFNLMKTKFVDQGIPVVLGECSAMRRLAAADQATHIASRAHFHDYVTEQANAHGFLPFYWDNGYTSDQQCGIFNRWSKTVFDQPTLDAVTLIDNDQYWAAHGDEYADPPAVPDAPDGLSAIGGDGQVELSWNASAGATGYNLYRNSDGGGIYATIATNVAATNYTDFEVTNGTTYYYVAAALNDGGESSNSVVASATPQALAADPASDPSPAHDATEVAVSTDLGWAAGANADLHRVFFGYDSNAVATATTNSTEFMGVQTETVYDPGSLVPSGRFFWRIDGVTSGGMSTTGSVWTFATTIAGSGGSIAGAVPDEGNGFEISFPSSPGQTYRIECTDSLSDDPVIWTIVSNNIPGTGNPIYILDSTVNTQCFYRAMLLNP